MNLTKILLSGAMLLTVNALADVKPARLFSNNMIIQRETKAPIWGQADVGEKVSVTGSWGQKATATADKNGKWIVNLQTPSARGPHTLTIKGNNTVELKNVLSGDVWLCSGQSNMAYTVTRIANPVEETKHADFPELRVFAVGYHPSQTALDTCSGSWRTSSAKTVRSFSATAYFTGRELHKKLNVPIGLVVSAVGSTFVETWTKRSVLKQNPFSLKRVNKIDKMAEQFSPEQAQKRYEQSLKKWEIQKAKAEQQNKRPPRKPKIQENPREGRNYPGALYNGMINPLIPLAIKGAIWYQGEANATSIEASEQYRHQLADMVKSWRNVWGYEFPFYFVQLPNWKPAQKNPVEHKDYWAVIRESFVHTAQNNPKCEMVTTIDLGEEKDIHPKNKQDVGLRLASAILNKTYQKNTPTTPVMKSFNIKGNEVIITFDYTGSGLMAKGDQLQSFAIAGEDKTFIWADAKIEKRIVQSSGKTKKEDVVVVSSKDIKKPAAVRYAWANNPDKCNLYSKEGFPASPFRTDSWDLMNY